MFAPENRNGWPFSISWSPDLVTKLGCAASGDAPECCGTVSATVVPPATTTAAAATASATRLDHPLGSNHFTCFMCRTHHSVAACHGGDLHDGTGYRGYRIHPC